jgi:pimeloyl-ACP methyl ester carboxylesterase
MRNLSRKKQLLAIAAVVLIIGLGWLLMTDNLYVWPVRNTLKYHLRVWLSGPLVEPTADQAGTLTGTVTTVQNQPVGGAWVLAAYPNGTTFSTRTDDTGRFQLDGLPPGTYRPVAGAPGYQTTQFGNFLGQLRISDNQSTTANAVLDKIPDREIAPGTSLELPGPEEFSCNKPLVGRANRWEISFDSAGQPNQPTFYYTPLSANPNDRLPLLLAIYPGPADSWECVSIPLAEAGYAVLAAGPAYTFDVESDLDELERLLDFAQQGQFPGTDGSQVALLGGSYSSLHVQRLLQRGRQNVVSALLLGPPTDLFDMRRRLENGSYIPPFGLDQAFRAIGLPSEEPVNYFDYSGAYHVRGDFPPLAILHSRNDEVVPYQQSELLARNLELVGAPYELHFFDGASHYLMDEGGEVDEVYDISLDFLARHFH